MGFIVLDPAFPCGPLGHHCDRAQWSPWKKNPSHLLPIRSHISLISFTLPLQKHYSLRGIPHHSFNLWFPYSAHCFILKAILNIKNSALRKRAFQWREGKRRRRRRRRSSTCRTREESPSTNRRGSTFSRTPCSSTLSCKNPASNPPTSSSRSVPVPETSPRSF